MPRSTTSMRWSWRLARVAGIGIYVHWTFLILIGFIVVSHLLEGGSAAMAIEGVVTVLAIFGCVTLHELGHALTARKYGIQTRDITLLPIGGIARLERMPDDPRQEFWVAVAGPAVNVVIAAVLFAIIYAIRGLAEVTDPARLLAVGGDFLSRLMSINIALVVFNLLPAFPMDGGRILRALLARRLAYTRATQIAATIGQAMAILLGFFGLFHNPMLLFIAIFVFLGAGAESQEVQMRSVFADVPVRDAMLTRFRTLSRNDPLSVAVGELLAGSQQDFPVVEDGRIVGVLQRVDLVRALSEQGRDVPVGQVMRQECGPAREDEPLDEVVRRMRETDCVMVPVQRGDQVVGLLTMDNVGEWLLVRSALQPASQTRPTARPVSLPGFLTETENRPRTFP